MEQILDFSLSVFKVLGCLLLILLFLVIIFPLNETDFYDDDDLFRNLNEHDKLS
jgi:hypothetical protein